MGKRILSAIILLIIFIPIIKIGGNLYNYTIYITGLMAINEFLNIKNIQLTHLLPEAIRPGYIFRGWYTDAEDGTRISKDTVVTNDRIYYAHWETPKIDVNTFVDGVQIDSRNYEGDLKNKFKFDIYINGEIKGNQVGDYNGNVLYGTSYQLD